MKKFHIPWIQGDFACLPGILDTNETLGNGSARDLQHDFVVVHAKLAAKAEKEGVSLNTLVVSLIAEGLGRRAAG